MDSTESTPAAVVDLKIHQIRQQNSTPTVAEGESPTAGLEAPRQADVRLLVTNPEKAKSRSKAEALKAIELAFEKIEKEEFDSFCILLFDEHNSEKTFYAWSGVPYQLNWYLDLMKDHLRYPE